MYTIGRLARRARVNTDSIRFYERQGLLSPATKTDSGYRLYTDDAVHRIKFVKRAQQCGFSLAEIRELLQMYSGDPSARVNGYNLATQKKAEIEKALEALYAMSRALTRLLDSRGCEAGRGPLRFEDSPLLSALEPARPEESESQAPLRTADSPNHADRRFAA
jgi:DNA-binding transcriptional MerR regulator